MDLFSLDPASSYPDATLRYVEAGEARVSSDDESFAYYAGSIQSVHGRPAGIAVLRRDRTAGFINKVWIGDLYWISEF